MYNSINSPNEEAPAMDRDPRFDVLKKYNHDVYLDLLVRARLDMKRAIRLLSREEGKTVRHDSFNRTINRIKRSLGFPSLADMLVWYELDYKGRADVWRERLGKRGWNPDDRTGLRYIADMLQAERNGISARREYVRAQYGVSMSTINREIGRFAGSERILKSLKWLLFVHCMYTELENRRV